MPKGFKFPNLIASDKSLFAFLDSDENEKQTSKRLASMCIIYSLVAIVLSALIFTFPLLSKVGSLIISICLFILVTMIGVAVPLVLLIKAGASLYFQFKLNKQKIVYIALIVFVLAVAAMLTFAIVTSLVLS